MSRKNIIVVVVAFLVGIVLAGVITIFVMGKKKNNNVSLEYKEEEFRIKTDQKSETIGVDTTYKKKATTNKKLTTVLLRCIVDGAAVYSEPDVNSPLIEYSGAHGSFGEVWLGKGELVGNENEIVNGFVKISYAGPAFLWYGYGWIPAKYMTNSVKCQHCKGKPMANRKCYICEGNGCLNCWYMGKKTCEYCEGYGYK